MKSCLRCHSYQKKNNDGFFLFSFEEKLQKFILNMDVDLISDTLYFRVFANTGLYGEIEIENRRHFVHQSILYTCISLPSVRAIARGSAFQKYCKKPSQIVKDFTRVSQSFFFFVTIGDSS